MSDQKPIILFQDNYNLQDLNRLRKEKPIWKECNIYAKQLREFFVISNSHLIDSNELESVYQNFVNAKNKERDSSLQGNWIYFPWSGILVHSVVKSEYYALRTNRNRDLITKEEQKKLSDFCVGLVGLSVGSNVATALAYTGVADTMKLAEFDSLETSNLNRIRARIDQIGQSKIFITAEQVYEINPYAHINCFSSGITKESLLDFVTQEPKPKLIFEIIDSFEMKIHLRDLARKYGVAVIMVTNLGDRILMDVERYDLDKNIEYFNGRAGEVPHDILSRPDITDGDKHKYAVELAGRQHIPDRALESVEKIGKMLVGRPQLASTVTTAAGFATYLARKIVLGEDFPGGSWLVDFDKVFSQDKKI